MSLVTTKKGNKVILRLFTGAFSGVKEVEKTDKSYIYLHTSKGLCKFSKETGKQVSPEPKKERFASYIEEYSEEAMRIVEETRGKAEEKRLKTKADVPKEEDIEELYHMIDAEDASKATDGQCEVTIVSADVKATPGNNHMIVVKFEIISGENKGIYISENYPLLENALWKLKVLLQAIGIKAEGKDALSLDDMVGKNLLAKVRTEEYNGKTINRIDAVEKLVRGKEGK